MKVHKQPDPVSGDPWRGTLFIVSNAPVGPSPYAHHPHCGPTNPLSFEEARTYREHEERQGEERGNATRSTE